MENSMFKYQTSKDQQMVCIRCPRGCILTVSRENDEWKVSGNTCSKGPEYAVQEITQPMRIITVLMRLDGTERPVSVKTDRAVPKEMIMRCVKEIYSVHPKAPVKQGDVLIRDLCGTGAAVIATRDS